MAPDDPPKASPGSSPGAVPAPSVDVDERQRGNQRVFRAVNDQIREIAASFDTDDSVEFLCECGSDGCVARIELTGQHYRELVDGLPSVLVTVEHAGRLNGSPVVAEYDRFIVAADR